jgi:hypothetical protein
MNARRPAPGVGRPVTLPFTNMNDIRPTDRLSAMCVSVKLL